MSFPLLFVTFPTPIAIIVVGTLILTGLVSLQYLFPPSDRD